MSWYSPQSETTQRRNALIDYLVVFCLICRLGFPGNFAQLFGGSMANSAIDYGSSILQVIIMMMGSANTVMGMEIINLKKKYGAIYAMMIIMFFVSLLVTENRVKQTTLILRFSITAFFALWLTDRYSVEYLLHLVYISFGIVAIINLLSYFVFRGVGFYVDEGYGYTFRGIYTQKNGLGDAFARGITLQITLLCIKKRNSNPVSLAFWMVLAAQLFLLIISKATTALLGAIAATGYVILFEDQKEKGFRLQWGIVYAVVSIGFIFLAMTILPLFEPMLNAIGKDATLSNRIPMWKEIIEFMTESHTFTGYGLLHFWESPQALKALHGYFERNSWYRTMSFGAHNILLEMWLDVGLIGIAVYLLTIIYSFRHVKRLTGDQYILCSVILILILIEGLTDRLYTNVNNVTLFFFIMLGVACNVEKEMPAIARKPERMEAAATGTDDKE